MGEYDSDEGKVSVFNEAMHRMKRYDELQRDISKALMNLLAYDPIYGKFEYEKAFMAMISILNQCSSNMTPEEKKKYREFRIECTTIMDFYPVVEKKNIDGFKTNRVLILNNSNYIRMRSLVFEMSDFTQEVLGRTGYASPTKEEEGGYD